MGSPDVLMRVFWPLDAPRREDPGLLVGWRNSGLDIFVVAVLHDIDVGLILSPESLQIHY